MDLVGGLDRGQAARSGEPAGPGRGGVVGAQDLEVAHQVADLGVGQGEALGIHHRVGEAGPHQAVADLVQVREGADMA